METLPPAPPPLTPEQAESMSIVMKTVASEFGPHYSETTKRMREEADARRAHEQALQRDRSAHELTLSQRALVFQVAVVVAIGAGVIGAMFANQWPIAEKMLIALLALGLGRALR